MNINYTSNPIYIDWLKDNDGNKISLPVNNEQRQVADGRVILDYVPDQFYKVTFAVNSTPTVEIPINEQITSVSQYKVDYGIGYVYVHPSLEASLLTYSYYKRGAVLYPASRIYTKFNSGTGTIESTLQESADAISTYDHKGVYVNTDVYVQNNVVTYKGSTYICSVSQTLGNYPTDGSYWRMMSAGYNDAGNYSGSTQYYLRDVVWYDTNKSFYLCTTTPTMGILPTNTTYWMQMINIKSIYDAEALRVTAESSRVGVESARVTAEGLRVTAESSRVTVEGARVTAESGRTTAESGRVTAEGTRTTNETNRGTAETGRSTAESSRVTVEGNRVTAETNRASAETSRVGVESARVTAEGLRATAESSRVTVESARVTAEGSRATAETGRSTAEGLRVTAESSRVTVESARVTAEGNRASAETTRGTNETGRTTAESSRVTVEGARVTAESGRVTAEGTRVSNETTRGTNETNRGTAETGRSTAEGLRVTAESGRVTAEGLRVSNETTRGTNETNRGTAESGRVTAEGLRVTAETARGTAEGLRASAETTRGTNETTRQNTYNAFINRGDYAGATAYSVKNMVVYNGSSYICKLASTGNLPTNTTYWDLLAQRGSNIVYRGLYSGATAYAQYDAATYNGIAYICKLASTGNLPTNTTYWDIFVDVAGTAYVSKAGDTMTGDLAVPRLILKSAGANTYTLDYNDTENSLDFIFS